LELALLAILPVDLPESCAKTIDVDRRAEEEIQPEKAREKSCRKSREGSKGKRGRGSKEKTRTTARERSTSNDTLS
jgi:hypothetical protein